MYKIVLLGVEWGVVLIETYSVNKNILTYGVFVRCSRSGTYFKFVPLFLSGS